MKKLVLIGAALLAWAIPAVADDASVLPAGVIRVYAVPVYSFINGGYDKDGKYSAFDSGQGKTQLFALGGAVEYGVNDWISAAVQWTPGATLWSKVDVDLVPSPVDLSANINGLWDVFAGAKILVVGKKAPVPNDAFRFAIAPGIIIPLPGTDFDKQGKTVADGVTYLLSGGTSGSKTGDVTVADADLHAFGYGARAYFDYVVNDQIFVNLYSETIFYNKVNKALSPGGPKADVEAGYKETLELEPHYTLTFGDDSSATFGLPLTYWMRPATKVDGNEVPDSASNALSLGPNASMFFYKTFLPLEFKAQYVLPLTGTSTQAVNSFIFQIRAYAKF